MKKDIVVILGMHRSGTSALTRVLNLMGLNIGDELVPAEVDNPRGFWEDARIVTIHDRFLEAIGRDSSDPRNIPEELWDGAAAHRARTELLQVLSTYDDRHALWGVKDPRLCRLLPLWEPLYRQIERTPHFLLTVRNPLEVASSLFARERLPLHRGLLLWLVSNLDAVAQTHDENRVIVSFNQLLVDWASVTDKIRTGLAIPWPAETEDTGASIAAFLDPQLRHHQTPNPAKPDRTAAPAVDTLLLEHWVASVYSLMQEAAHDPQSTINRDICSIMERVSQRLLDLERLSDRDEAPHFHRWFAKETAWDFLQRTEQRFGATLPGIRIPVTGLLGPYYKTRKLLARARRTLS